MLANACLQTSQPFDTDRLSKTNFASRERIDQMWHEGTASILLTHNFCTLLQPNSEMSEEVIYLNITHNGENTYHVKEVSSADEANALSATGLSHIRDARPPSGQEGAKTLECSFNNIEYSYQLSTYDLGVLIYTTYKYSDGGSYQVGPFYGNLKDSLIVDYDGKGSTTFYLRNGNEFWINDGQKDIKAVSF
ncbi:hypothetical protein VTL71DRAFT_15281 [Oculimacula yallundae]|uniref:Uncharacterized protein n=1 Tax=Oculimacula yallundae TaxID=86028 RepID=A0ABR4CG49_9HELO